MIEIKIPNNWFEGFDCLEYEIPWQVPESIFKESDNINKNDIAFELGTGGSTLFLSRRCKEVVAIETSTEWYNTVNEKLVSDGLLNVDYHLIPNENDIVDFILNFDTTKITILSVDTQGGYNRSLLLETFLSKGISDNLKMIIIDNYSHEGLFPNHYNKNIMDLQNWEYFSYDCDRYAGSGTRIYLKKNDK